MTDTIKFLKVRDVTSPTRANKYDAGIDFYIPVFTSEFIEVLKKLNPELDINEERIVLGPNERVLIPSGIHCQMATPGRALIAGNKSGVANKKGLIFGAQVVDYEYQGEIHLSLINTSEGFVTLSPGDKILQFIEMPVFNSNIEISVGKEITDFYKEETSRGPKGFGSTDNI